MTEDGEYSFSTNNPMSGINLRVAIDQFPNKTNIYRNASGHVIGYGGIYYEQLLWISLNLNFSMTMKPLGETKNSFIAMRNLLYKGEVDILCQPYAGFESYSKITELAVLLASEGYGIICPYPLPQTSKYGPASVFSPNVWIGLAISILVCIWTLQLIIYINRKYFDDDHSSGFNSLSDIWVYVFATITNHGGYFKDGCRSIGMTGTTWCIATFIFVNIYSSCLTSFLMLTSQRPEINSMDDIIASDKYQIAFVKGSGIELSLLEATSGIYKKLGDKLRRCDEGRCSVSGRYPDISPIEVAGKRVLEGNFVALLNMATAENFMFEMNSKGVCQMTMAKEANWLYRHYYMLLRKDDPYALELNKASLWWHAFGLQSFWFKKEIRKSSKCVLNYNSQGESVHLVDLSRIKLEQLYVPFIVLFIGYVVALIQFLRERFIR